MYGLHSRAALRRPHTTGVGDGGGCRAGGQYPPRRENRGRRTTTNIPAQCSPTHRSCRGSLRAKRNICVRRTDVEATDWQAEHAVQPAVVTREVCGGDRDPLDRLVALQRSQHPCRYGLSPTGPRTTLTGRLASSGVEY